jgi:uncharacterized delta-60 repeat protein
VSYSIGRGRRWRTFAMTLALSVGTLAVPAAALADGGIDTTFNGTGYHFGSDGAGIDLDPVVDRVPTVRVPVVVQSDGKVVIGGRSADDFMTLVRYNADGTLDSTFGSGGVVRQQFPVTPGTVANPPALGPSGAVAMTQDASGNLLVAGIGGGASEFVARFSAAGAYVSSTVCFAPSNIAYTPRALAVRSDGSIIVAGSARDRRQDATGTAARTMYGARAVVTLPASGNDTTGCGPRQPTLGSDGVTIDGLGHDGSVTNAALEGRWYDGVVALPDNRYVVVSTNGPDGTGTGTDAWVQRYTASGAPDPSFNGGGRVSIPSAGLHAAALLPDGSLLAAGETNGQMLLAHIADSGAILGLPTFSAGAGNNTGQALAVQPDGSAIVGGGALAGTKSALALVRFTSAGAVDPAFGNGGQTLTPIPGTHDAYITGLVLNGPMIVASGRARTPVPTPGASGHLYSVAARYYASGSPIVPPPPAPPVTPVVTPPFVAPLTVAPKTTVVTTVTRARSCVVPKVTGRKLKKALRIVFARGCKSRVRYVFSTREKNTVLAQSRKPGKKLGFRSVVKLTIAKPKKH